MDVFDFLVELQTTPRDWSVPYHRFDWHPIRRLNGRVGEQCPAAAVLGCELRRARILPRIREVMHLGPLDAERLINAADGSEPFYPAIRATLLAACGLADDTEA